MWYVVNNRNLSGVKNDQFSLDFIGPLQRTTNDVSYSMYLLARLVNQVRKDCGNNNLSLTCQAKIIVAKNICVYCRKIIIGLKMFKLLKLQGKSVTRVLVSR